MLIGDVDPDDLATAGWGIVIPAGLGPGIVDSLSPLTGLRRNQVGDMYRVLHCRPGEDAKGFLGRHGVRLDVVDPRNGIPYYLLLVGSPDLISFDFQNTLSVYFAVGRIDFADVDQFANYAQSVLRAESRPARQSQKVTFFCADKVPDPSMQGAVEFLMQPAVETANRWPWRRNFRIELIEGTDATLSSLTNTLGSGNPPALLVTAASGIGFPAGHALQRTQQGSLLCSPSRAASTTSIDPLALEWFSRLSVPSGADLSGMISIHLGSFSAGTPKIDSLAVQITSQEQLLSLSPFIAPLPQQLLSNPGGGALAVMGHVDRIGFLGAPETRWNYLRDWLKNLVGRLTKGERAGNAIGQTKSSWAAFSFNLAEVLMDATLGGSVDDTRIVELWMKANFMRSFVLLGDPAVRLSPTETEILSTARPD